ncbi:tetratricopeptide repeat protein, partial [bacterium]|nr:tetratricopeptide repeat protein [bacterium]
MTTGFLLFLLVVVIGAVVAFLYLQRRERRKLTVQSPYTEALHALLIGDQPHALQKLKQTVQGDTNNIDAYIRLGNLHIEMNDYARALKIHRMLTLRVDLTKAQRVEVYRALARDYTVMKDFPRALESLDQILQLSKNDVEALKAKQALLEKQKNWAAAFETAKKLQSIDGAVSFRRLAILKVQEALHLAEKGKEREGRLRLREAVRLDGTYPAPFLYWGNSYIREGRIEDAVNTWKKLLDRDPAHSYLIFQRLAD